MEQCNLFMVDYKPCKHKLTIIHTEKGVDITCKHCNLFTVSTSREDVARVVGIFQR